MYLTATQYILIPRRRIVFSTDNIVVIIDNRLQCKYVFHTSLPAFGTAGDVVFEFFGEGG
jgi:hypothetical protein